MSETSPWAMMDDPAVPRVCGTPKPVLEWCGCWDIPFPHVKVDGTCISKLDVRGDMLATDPEERAETSEEGR